MPAIKLRIPNEDVAKYGSGNLSQLAKSRLIEALGAVDWPPPAEPSSALPATAISVWLSADQIDAITLRGVQSKIPGVEPAATAMLHAWAQRQVAPAANESAAPALVSPAFPAVTEEALAIGESLHSATAIRASVQRFDALAAAAHRETPPWDVEDTGPGVIEVEPPAPVAPHSAAEAPASSMLDQINTALGDRTRPAQAEFFTRILSEFPLKQTPAPVIAAEAATGIGKTRVFIAVMAEWQRTHPDEKAVLAAPSYNVLFQAVNLWKSLQQQLPDVIPDATTLLGQQEFVSRASIEHALHEDHGHVTTPDMANRIRQWMADGAPAPEGDALAQPWLLRSLIEVTDGQWPFAGHCVLQSADEEDPGRQAYEAQFREARETPWVFCTHSMLATDVRRRIIAARAGYKAGTGKGASEVQWTAWQKMDEEERKGLRFHEQQNDLVRSFVQPDGGKLPDIGLLMIDEGHLLEENFARIFATGISIASMMRSLKALREAYPKKILAQELADIAEAWDILRQVGASNGGDTLMSQHNAAATEAVTKVRLALKSIVARKFGESAPVRRLLSGLIETSRALNLAASSNGSRPGMTTRISWSPSVQWPSIEVGRYDISREMDFLWTLMVNDRAVLVSATLYDDFSHNRIEGTRRTLSIRQGSIRTLPPVRPHWTIEPVTAFLPRPVSITETNRAEVAFYRPSSKFATGEAFDQWATRWREQIAEYIAQVYQSAEGGTLVLMTSHQDRAAVVALLEHRIPDEALIDHRPEIGVEGVKRLYLRATASGIKPLLVAVGGAWTGLDLSSDALSSMTGAATAPDRDTVLTDLVIPNAPIGANRTLTHQYRREFNGAADISSTAILLRQGIGRLVRREGLPRRSRRLHFLDARLHDPRWNAFFLPIKRILSVYQSVREI